MKSASRNMFLLIVISILALNGCVMPGSDVPLSERAPENPDPENSIDPDDTNYVSIGSGIFIYANIGNEIRKFASDDSEHYDVIATGLDPSNPQFFITDDGDYAVYTKNIGTAASPHYVVVVREIDSEDDETFLDKQDKDQSLESEFAVAGRCVIYSDNGELVKFDIDDPSNPVNIIDDDSAVCNHFPRIFADGTITYTHQIPTQSVGGTLNVCSYTGSPEEPLGEIYPGAQEFGTLLYPTTISGNKLIFTGDSEHTNALILWDYVDNDTEAVYIRCGDTSSVDFSKIYQTPNGGRIILYGYDGIYWFPNDGTVAEGDYAVSGKDFLADIHGAVSTPDETYTVIHDEHGIWIYDEDFTQVNCRFNWLNQSDKVLWIDVK